MGTPASAEQRRCRLMVSDPGGELASLLSPDLVYVHATGLVHSRDQLMEFLRTRIRYHDIQRRALRLVEAGDVAWMTGLMRFWGQRPQTGEAVDACSFVSQVWERHGEIWTLRVFQSTKVDAPLWDSSEGMNAPDSQMLRHSFDAHESDADHQSREQ